jgi:hypothetical protein
VIGCSREPLSVTEDPRDLALEWDGTEPDLAAERDSSVDANASDLASPPDLKMPALTLQIAAPLNYATGQAPGTIAVADLDGDGKLDLVALCGGIATSALVAPA